MSTLHHSFNDIAKSASAKKADQPNYPPPFSIRFTFEECQSRRKKGQFPGVKLVSLFVS